MSIDVGVPQGSVLGPLLFLIYINALPSDNQHGKYVLFADDKTASIADRSFEGAIGKACEMQSEVEAWFTKNGLILNHEKTNHMIFSLRDLGETPFPTVECSKFLGVHIDTGLTWGPHTEAIAKRMNGGIFVLRSLSNRVSRCVLRTAYFALCHSVLSYAVISWGHSPGAGRVFGLQRRAIRVVAALAYREDCRNAFVQLGILTLPCLYIYQNLLHIYQNRDGYQTNGDIHGLNTRGGAEFSVPHRRVRRCQNGPDYFAVKFFNRIPLHVRQLDFHKFKRLTYQFLVKKAYYNMHDFLEDGDITITL